MDVNTPESQDGARGPMKSRPSDEELAANPWGVVGHNRLPWWLVIATPIGVDLLTLLVLWWENEFRRTPNVVGTMMLITTISGVLVGGGIWIADKVLYYGGGRIRRHRINSDLLYASFFSAVAALFLWALLKLYILPGRFTWRENWFAVVLISVFGSLGIGGFAEWRGRRWGARIVVWVTTAFLAMLMLMLLPMLVVTSPPAIRGTVALLCAVYGLVAAFGLISVLRSRRGGDMPPIMAFAWPMMLIFKPHMLLPTALVVGCCAGGEFLARRAGATSWWAVGGSIAASIALSLAVIAFALYLFARFLHPPRRHP